VNEIVLYMFLNRQATMVSCERDRAGILAAPGTSRLRSSVRHAAVEPGGRT
jgi:hypothetical protein